MKSFVHKHQFIKILVSIALVAYIIMPTSANAQNKRQLERERDKIEQEIRRLTTDLSKARKNAKKSKEQINLVNKRIKERNKLIDNINKQVTVLDNRIMRTEDSLIMVRDQIRTMKQKYARVVTTMYGLKQNVNSMSLLLDNESYNIAYLKLKYLQEYSQYCRFQEQAISRREELYRNMSQSLQRQKQEKSTLLAQQQKERDALNREQQKRQKDLNKSQQDEKNLKQQISKKEQQKRKLQQQIQQLINAEVAKMSTESPKQKSSSSSSNSSTSGGTERVHTDAGSADFVNNKGRLSWPVNYKSVAREYGIYTHESGGQNKNNGIDLICSPGATVYAVFNGTVARVFTTPNDTKGVIIRHGSYMTVYAGMGAVNVSQGAKVTTHQVIGTVAAGNDGTSEFSFQVWCGTDALNPRRWLR